MFLPKRIRVLLAKLTLHPAHNRFPPLPDAKREQMKESMQRRGQKDPIEIISTYVVIDGRTRLNIASELKWPSLRAIVRSDIDASDNAAIERAVIEAVRKLRR